MGAQHGYLGCWQCGDIRETEALQEIPIEGLTTSAYLCEDCAYSLEKSTDGAPVTLETLRAWKGSPPDVVDVSIEVTTAPIAREEALIEPSNLIQLVELPPQTQLELDFAQTRVLALAPNTGGVTERLPTGDWRDHDEPIGASALTGAGDPPPSGPKIGMVLRVAGREIARVGDDEVLPKERPSADEIAAAREEWLAQGAR